MNIFVIGCGRWGSLITWYLDHIGHHVTLYGRQSSPRMQSFLATRQNDLLTLPDSVGLTTDLRDVEQAEMCIRDSIITGPAGKSSIFPVFFGNNFSGSGPWAFVCLSFFFPFRVCCTKY